MTRILFSFVFLYFLISTISCKKESFITDQNAQLSFSADTIHFDTVFTSTGSVTHFFKVFNRKTKRDVMFEASKDCTISPNTILKPRKVNLNK